MWIATLARLFSNSPAPQEKPAEVAEAVKELESVARAVKTANEELRIETERLRQRGDAFDRIREKMDEIVTLVRSQKH